MNKLSKKNRPFEVYMDFGGTSDNKNPRTILEHRCSSYKSAVKWFRKAARKLRREGCMDSILIDITDRDTKEYEKFSMPCFWFI